VDFTPPPTRIGGAKPTCGDLSGRRAHPFVRVADHPLGIEAAEQCCFAAGIPRHSVGYSLGFEGKTEKLPSDDVLMLATMCGHGMVSQSLAKKMIDWVKEGRRTPEQAASYMTRFCSCGVFNPARAARVLRQAGQGKPQYASSPNGAAKSA
jgi:hypothetical protein